MNIADFTQLSIGSAAIVGIVVIVKEFLKSSREKDIRFIAFIMEQEKNFAKIIGNHIEHNTEASQKLEKTNDRLARAIEQLIKFSQKK